MAEQVKFHPLLRLGLVEPIHFLVVSLRPPATYASVHAPALVPGADRPRVEIRLARNLAVLMGVVVRDHPSGRTWVTRYGDLTVSEIGRGWPRPLSGEKVAARDEGDEEEAHEPEPPHLDVIANATLHRFGPETKAALVVAGSDILFQPLERMMSDVLEVLGTSDDGQPLADSMRVTAWASLVADIYQSQPALFVAAIQARSVQRSATGRWWPVTHRRPQRKAEFPIVPQVFDGVTHPSDLGVLDRVMREYVKPRSPLSAAATEGEGGGPSETFLAESLTDRWLRLLVYSADGGSAWIGQDDDGSYVDAYQPHLAALSSFAVDAYGQYDKIVPFGADPTTQPEVFRRGDPMHVKRMIPRTPSLPEFAKLPKATQEALARTAVQMLRVLRDSSVFASAPMLEESLPCLESWSTLTRNVLGTDNDTTKWVELVRARLVLNHHRDSADGDVLVAMQQAVRMSYEGLRQAAAAGRMCLGEWVEVVYDSGANLNSMWQDMLVSGRTDEAIELRSGLERDWADVLTAVGIDANRPELTSSTAQPGLAGLIHNYIGFQVRLPDTDARLAALNIGRSQLLPARQQVADVRGNDTALRTSLQVLLRGSCLTLPDVADASARDVLLSDIRRYTRLLAQTQLVQSLMSDAEQPERTTHLNCLEALSLGLVTLGEEGDPCDARLLQRYVNKAVVACLRAGNVRQLSELSDDSARIGLLLEIIRRFRGLTGLDVKVDL